MKQILQNLSNGKTTLANIPCPNNANGSVLIASNCSVVSAGTERMLVDFGKANFLNKAKQQPDKVKMVLNKIKTDGLAPTFEAVQSKLNQPIPLGYSNAGIVIESNSNDFIVGDRVVSNGSHAEVVRVPQNLCCKIPANVDDESAAFTVLSSIGLQGVRLLQPTLGESFVVNGLGLIGLICVQILRANGCKVLGIDLDTRKCELAKQFGAEVVNLSKNEDPLVFSRTFSKGRGVDGVLITAASKSDEIMHQSAEMCRQRGRIVLVGVVGLNLRRDDYYKKEISIQVSSSYGPGRYDPFYEELGNDYPFGFVRWTEKRNFEAVLEMMSSNVINLKPLISSRFNIEDAIEAYKLLDSPDTLGIVLNYQSKDFKTLKSSNIQLIKKATEEFSQSIPVVGFIGAGNYASRTLIPAFKNAGANLDTLVTNSGISGYHHGKINSFLCTSTNEDDLWANSNLNTVSIVTRHDLHAKQVIRGLKSKKNIFVEKPLAITLAEVDAIEEVYENLNISKKIRLMVGFNRRFAPHIIKMKKLLESSRSPKSIIIIVNAGEIPADHWVQDHKSGGGRIIGEACHFIDLMRHLVGYKISSYTATMIGDNPSIDTREDKVTITLSFEDGSFGTIHYFANGGKSLPKERIEVFCDNAVLQMINYRKLIGFGWKGFKKMNLYKQDKGQKSCVKAFLQSITNGTQAPIPYDEIIEVSRISIKVSNLLKK
jgi:predicted dehydrogenase/threonine dehydrogenase-like Zn-dependent dehydrogenase